MTLKPDEYQELSKGFQSAFPDKMKIKQMVFYRLGMNLEIISQAKNLSDLVFDLIVWAESQGQLENLITGAYKDNPNNPELKTFYEKYKNQIESSSTKKEDSIIKQQNPLAHIKKITATKLNEIKLSRGIVGTILALPRTLIPASIISLISTSIVIGMRVLGFLQPLELWAYDQMIRLLPPVSTKDARILVVTIDQEDEKYEEVWTGKQTLKDEALSTLLDKLEPIKPTTIGVDIYHEENVVSHKLLHRFEQDERIFFICYTHNENNKSVASFPSKIIEKRTGFNNFPLDEDNLIRRSLLTHKLDDLKDPCSSEYSFSFLISLQYLEENKGIKAVDAKSKKQSRGNFFTKYLGLNPEIQGGKESYAVINDENKVEGWQIGNSYLPILYRGMGGYQQFKDGGSQILFKFDYYDEYPQDGFYQIDLRTILEHGLPNKFISYFQKSRPIVLVGNISSKQHNKHITSYGEIKGIFLNAQVISYILDVGLNKQFAIHWWPIWLDWLWILFWSVSIVSLRLWTPKQWFLLVISGLIFLIIPTSGYLIFRCQLLWIPVIPAVINIIGTTSLLLSWEQKKRKNIHSIRE